MSKKNIRQYNYLHNFLYSYFIKKNKHLGHNSIKLQKSWHGDLNKTFLGIKNKTVVFDLKSTLNYLIKALFVFTSIIKSNGSIFIINTNPEFSKLIHHIKKRTSGKKTYLFFSDCGWTNGTLTNWCEVSNKVKTFVNFYYGFDNFLTKNNIHFPNYKKMKKNYKGFLNEFKDNSIEQQSYSAELNKKWKPDLIILLSTENTESIIKEASNLNIPTIALVDSNSTISTITYPIPTNTYSYFFVWFFCRLLTKLLNKYC